MRHPILALAVLTLALAACDEVPTKQQQDNPFDSLGVNWHPPVVTVASKRMTVSVGDVAKVVAHGVDNGSIQRYFWTVDGNVQVEASDTLRLSLSSQGTRVVRVYARDNDGVRSREDTTIVLARDKAPLLLSPLNEALLANNAATLNWASGLYNSSYTVYLDTLDPPTKLASAVQTDTFYQATNLAFNKPYYWKVVGKNSSAATAESPVWSFTTGSKPAIPTDGLVAYWPFNGNAKDESGNGNDGIVNGATLAADRFGGTKSSFNFDGSSSRISIPNSSNFQFSTSLSVVAWIRFTAYPSAHASILSHWYDGTDPDRGFNLEVSSTGSVAFNTSPTTSAATPAMTLNDGKWHLFIGSLDGLHQRVYIDGVCRSTTPFSGSISNQNVPLTIGYDADIGTEMAGYFFNGAIDDIRIYNRELSTDEIQALYHEGGYQPPLDAPTLSASGKDSTSISLRWSEVTDATSYTLQKSDARTGPFTDLYTGSDTIYTQTGLTKNQTICYRVKASTASNSSIWSDTTQATVGALFWKKVDSIGPSKNGPIAYDSDRQIAVMFAGGSADFNSDTWEYDGTAWRQVDISGTSPHARDVSGKMVYDSYHKMMIMQGGWWNDDNDDGTWQYKVTGLGANDRTWVRIAQTTCAFRGAPAMAYDNSRHQILSMGGNHYQSFYNDTWRFNGSDTSWVKLVDWGATRFGAGLVYDSKRDRFVLFGGTGRWWSGDYEQGRGNTSEFDPSNATWSEVVPEGTKSVPGPRLVNSMVYDPIEGVTYLLGGSRNSDAYSYGDMWQWDGSSWKEIPLAPGNPTIGIMWFDSSTKKVMLFSAPNTYMLVR